MRKSSTRKKTVDWKKVASLGVRAALGKQALDLLVLDVAELTDIAHYFVIASGRTDRQVDAIVDAIEETMERAQITPLGIEGRGGQWVLLDYGGAIFHIFTPETREYYRLDSLWMSAPIYGAEEFIHTASPPGRKSGGGKE